MKKDIKKRYVELLYKQCVLLDSIVLALSQHAEKTQDPHERKVLDLLNEAMWKVEKAETEAHGIPETDS